MAWALFLFISNLRYSVAIGTITGYHGAAGADNTDVFAPIVEFQLPDGRKITFTEKTHSNETIFDMLYHAFLKYVLKKDVTQVKVLYDPNNPQKARVNSISNIYWMPIVMLVIGVCIILNSIPAIDNFITGIVDFFEGLSK